MKKFQNSIYCIMALAMIAIASCSKIDDYKTKYLNGGSAIYPGIIDSVHVFSGKNRVKVTGLFTSDPKIVKYRVFWNGRQDSIEVPVTRTSGVDTASVIINGLPEGLMNFEIRTYDAAGNVSIPVYTSAQVYGAVYQSSLLNRPIDSAILRSNGSAGVYWADVNAISGVIGMQILYTDNTGGSHDTTLLPASIQGVSSFLPNYKAGNKFQYRTLYKPVKTAIDTFYTAYQTQGVKADITSLYLSNTGPSFQRATFDGRWGTLAAPWVTNEAAKNKGGVNGGYAGDEGGVINWETWGNTPVSNGIIYQATSAPLPAGSYTVSFDEYSEIQANSSVYCVAAAGGNGIPVLADLSTALGYVGLYNGANVGATGPSASDTRSFIFTITTPQVVSIGFLGNIIGNGNPGSYFQVKKIQLFSN